MLIEPLRKSRKHENVDSLLATTLSCGSVTLTIQEIQILAERGKLRVRVFGADDFYGVGAPFYGDLKKAAEAIPHALGCGLAALYSDQHGLFIGPTNPELIDSDPFASEDESDE